MSIWKPTEKITYINDDIKLGIEIDWNKVRKEYKKLNIPKDTHYPLKADLSKTGYVIDLSDRSRGKTTNKLIVGLLLFKMYGIELQYIRQKKADCALKMIRDLYETVKQFHYIEKIFDNAYNDITYYGKRWNLVYRNTDTGEVEDFCEDYCTICHGLDESDSLKSTFNAPKGDMIFHDEFITSMYGYNDFVRFSDMCKTIIRDRLSPVIFMSANTIDKNSPWFDELCIRKEVDTMDMGEDKYIESELGTHLYVEILAENISETRFNVNKRFWGFPNPKLSSITGRGVWATESYPHIPEYEKDKQPEIIQNNLFISMSGKYIKLKLVHDEERGVVVFVTPATRTYDDSIILTVDEIKNEHMLFAFGKGTIVDIYWKLYAMNKFYYSRNSEGAFLKSYIDLAHQSLRVRGI